MNIVGVDLGQKHDPTAVAVVASCEIETGFDHATWQKLKETRVEVRHLERLPLNTPYPEVVDRVKRIVANLSSDPPSAVVVDGTGVGVPVVDLLRRAALGCSLVPVTITAGEKTRRDGGYWRVPKRDLVSGLQLVLEQGRLRVAGKIRDAGAFLKELQQMRVAVSSAGHEQFGAWRENTHDDLVLAVALANWWLAKANRPIEGTQNLIYPFCGG